MDFVKREDQNVIDEDVYKNYWESIQKTQQTDVNEYQHTPISMEQLHQAMQSSLNAGTIMHNFQLPLSPRQMSTLMLKTNHLSRNLNFNDIPAHLQRNIELDLVHNIANELPPNLRHEEILLGRGIDLNLARMNELELQNNTVLTQTLVQNLNDNLALADVNLSQNLRADLPHDLNHELDLSHHLNRNLEQEILQDRRTPMQLQDGLLDQSLGQRLEPLPQRLDMVQRLDQRLVATGLMHDGNSDHLMPFHIKSEQEDDGYFYENINQALPSVNTMNGHIPEPVQPQALTQDQMYVYSNHVPPLPTIDVYQRQQSYPQNYTPPIRDNPQNLVVHRQFENHSPYEDVKKDSVIDNVKTDCLPKMEEPKENMKPNDNKIYYQEYPSQNFEADKNAKTDDAPLISKEFDIRGEYICFKCSVIFPSKRLLKQHSKVCDKDSEESSEKTGKFSCTQCSYKCQAPATLKIHERIHSGVKPYSCNFCSYKSGQKNNVAKHILVHMKQKPFRCQYCDYRCAQKNNLVVHERTHTGYKPFACPYCDYRTVQKPNLVKHMYLHTDQKPFSCDMCNYRCVQKTNLTKHKQRHLNEKDGDAIDVKTQVKPYRPRQKTVKCPHCSYRCVQKASLEKHIMFKHNGSDQTVKSNEFAEQTTDETEYVESGNIMNDNESSEEPIQNLSVKKDSQVFEGIEHMKDALHIQS